jgi:hypothetical protein
VIYLADGRYHAVGKDVFSDPRIGVIDGPVTANGIQDKQPVVLQASSGHLYVGNVVLDTDVLKHPDGQNVIKFFVQIPIVFKQNAYDRASHSSRA